MRAIYKLLESSWRDDAVQLDRAKGVYTAPELVREIGHAGKFFQVPGASARRVRDLSGPPKRPKGGPEGEGLKDWICKGKAGPRFKEDAQGTVDPTFGPYTAYRMERSPLVPPAPKIWLLRQATHDAIHSSKPLYDWPSSRGRDSFLIMSRRTIRNGKI